jgi:hypothetical protein
VWIINFVERWVARSIDIARPFLFYLGRNSKLIISKTGSICNLQYNMGVATFKILARQ